MKTVKALRVEYYGAEHAQYHHGLPTLPGYEDCYLGVGETPATALEDALERLAQNGWDTEGVETWNGADALRLRDTDEDAHAGCVDEFCYQLKRGKVDQDQSFARWHEGCELHHYVRVYVSEGT